MKPVTKINYPASANYGYRQAKQKQADLQRFYDTVGFVPPEERKPQLTWSQWFGYFLMGWGLADLIWRSRRYRREYLVLGIGAYLAYNGKVKRGLARYLGDE